LQRLGTDLPDGHRDRRHRFIEFYTALIVFHVSDPTQQLLPALFQNGSLEDRIGFASHLGYFLRQMQPAAKQLLWDSWLHRYWQGRLQGVLAALDDKEIRKMLDWLPDLEDAFPAGTSLAARSPTVHLEHSHLLLDLRDESDLVLRYPTETAELLIYLCNCDISYHKNDLGTIAARLSGLSPELRRRLDEALARAGVIVSGTNPQ
ncbi:MAG TPA: DUF4020 domain-containing protein, partial [Gammaproteobacteria bacterium]